MKLLLACLLLVGALNTTHCKPSQGGAATSHEPAPASSAQVGVVAPAGQSQPGPSAAAPAPQSPAAHSAAAPPAGPTAPGPQSAAPGQPPVDVHQVQGSAGYYPPAGVLSIVGPRVGQPAGAASDPQQQQQQQQQLQQQQQQGQSQYQRRAFEQYGQPESTALPPNYKPFGSFGLYIGGNPADGYYTNYYKALSASVSGAGDKQQQAQQQLEAGRQPLVKSAFAGASGSSPVEVYYPYGGAYTPADFNSYYYQQHPAAHFGVNPAAPASSAYYDAPAQAGYEPFASGIMGASLQDQTYYSGAGLAKNRASQPQLVKKEGATEGQAQSRSHYVYSPAVSPKYAQVMPGHPVIAHHYDSTASGQQITRASSLGQDPQQQQQQAQQQQVLAYPVPVGSQIVGSQPGGDGSFYPYGVHAYTRYVVKPTMVTGQQEASQSGSGSPVASASTIGSAGPSPVERSGVVSGESASAGAAYPIYMAQQPGATGRYYYTSAGGYYPQQTPTASGYYYGFPVSQLHYSQPSMGAGGIGASGAHGSQGAYQTGAVHQPTISNVAGQLMPKIAEPKSFEESYRPYEGITVENNKKA